MTDYSMGTSCEIFTNLIDYAINNECGAGFESALDSMYVSSPQFLCLKTGFLMHKRT